MDHQPLSQTEETLLAFWRDLFANGEIGVEDDFFVLGGHSLLAARLSTRVADVFGFELPLAQVFETPTVAELATYIDERRAAEQSPALSSSALVRLKSGHSRLPLFCMHNLLGGIGDYLGLARCFGPEQPVYAVQARGLLGEDLPLTSISAMAAHCVSEIRKLQLRGPYHLAGSSFAGLIALEAARQLHASGEEVALLALFDTWLRHYPAEPRLVSYIRSSIKRRNQQTNFLLKRQRRAAGSSGQPAYLRELDKAIADVRATSPDLPQDIMDLETRHNSILEGSQLAAISYRPAPYAGRIVYFYAEDRLDAPELDQIPAWTYLAGGGLDLHRIPGNHHQMLGEPHVHTIVRIIGDQIGPATSSQADLAYEPF